MPRKCKSGIPRSRVYFSKGCKKDDHKVVKNEEKEERHCGECALSYYIVNDSAMVCPNSVHELNEYDPACDKFVERKE